VICCSSTTPWRDALHLQVVAVACHVVEQQHRAPAAGEVVLQRQYLAPIAQGATGEEAQLRQRIEDQARRLDARHVVQDLARRVTQFHLRRMEHGVLLFGLQAFLVGYQFADVDALKGPAVGQRYCADFLFRLGQGDVQDPLALSHALHQELERERGLARARLAFQQVKPVGCEAAAQDVVQAFDACARMIEWDLSFGHGTHLSVAVDASAGGVHMARAGCGRITAWQVALPAPAQPTAARRCRRR
jgi:hypothetical protein